MLKILRIGKGKNMSVPKAALVFYFSEYEGSVLTYGHMDEMHRIIDIAGAKHQSMLSPTQVISSLRNSPYWDCNLIRGFYPGLAGHGGACVCKPSKKGEQLYKLKLIKDEEIQN